MNVLKIVDDLLNNITNIIDKPNETKDKDFTKYCIEKNNPVKDMDHLMRLFNERVYDIVPEYLNEIEHQKNNHENFKNKYFSPIDKENITTLEVEEQYRDDIRELKDFCTDIVNYQIFSHTGAFAFMYIVDRIHKIVLDIYKEKKHLHKLDIIFIYKGGNFLKQIKDMFFTKLPGEAAETINKKYTEFFAKSDLDYSIYINPKLTDYDNIYTDICNLAYKIQLTLKRIFMSNPYVFFHWYKFNDAYRTYVLDYYHTKGTNTLKCFRDPHNSRLYNHEMTSIIFNDISSLGKKDARVYKQKPNQYMFKSSDKDKVHKYNVHTPLGGPLYVSFNDSIEFVSSKRLLLTKFNLIRTKFNFNIYTQRRITLEQQDIKEKMHEIGGELIDVSVSHKDDADVQHFFDDIYINVIKIQYIEPPSGFLFKNLDSSYDQYTYSLEYMYYDLHKIIFKLYEYPWDERKYKKRLYRLFFISIIHYFGGESGREIKDIEGVNKRVHDIYDYIKKVYDLIFIIDDSVLNCLKYKKRMNKTSHKLSKELNQLPIVFDLNKYTNKHLISVLKDSMKVLEKVLVSNNLLKNNNKYDNVQFIIEQIESLKKFMDDVIDNVEVILKIIQQTKDFCASKSISLDLLKEFRFTGY